jgi:hypothetical protein
LTSSTSSRKVGEGVLKERRDSPSLGGCATVLIRRANVSEREERRRSYQCSCCRALWDGPETWLAPFDLERLCCGEPACRHVVAPVSALPLSDYLATPESAKAIREWVR